MLRHTTAVPRLVTLFLASCLCASSALAASPVEEARAHLAKGEAREAVDCLESALPEADAGHLPAMLETLREAYEKASAKADAEGKDRDARRYRDALGLLGHKVTAKAAPETLPAPIATPPIPATPSSDSSARIESTNDEPSPSVRDDSAAPDDLARADAAWRSRDYLEAGKHFAALAEAGQLPQKRRDHWAYCRLVAVLGRINDAPKSPAAWAEIHAEIDHIRLLSPGNWYSEYLRNVVIERSGGRRGTPGGLVVRGAAPEETPRSRPSLKRETPRRETPSPVRRPPASAESTAQPATSPAAEPVTETGRPGPRSGAWQTFTTPSFQIFHQDETLARQVAAKAEAARRDAAKRWTGGEPTVAWTPRCELYLYPTAAAFAAETGQSPDSPGFSTAGLSGGRVTARMVKLRVDYPKMLDAVVPHEVTHVVLADLFPSRQIPRWADEGMAVLSEPPAEQALRVRDLADPLNKDVLFRLDALMTSDYPGGTYWALYYAQSVSLTRYLSELGTPPQFVRFVRATQASNIDTALRQTYKIDGVADLEARWKAHARANLNPATASASASEDVKRR